MGIYYSFQTLEAYENLQKKGSLSGMKNYVFEPYLNAYHWLVGQMDKRLPIKLKKNTYPIWLWTEYPSLNTPGHLYKNEKGVRLTLSIPDNHVLNSNFEPWHCVLNDGFLPYTEEEDDLFDKGLINISKEKSWNRMFKLKELQNKPYWYSEEPSIQGTTPYITLEQILRVDYFTAK